VTNLGDCPEGNAHRQNRHQNTEWLCQGLIPHCVTPTFRRNAPIPPTS